MLAEIFKRSPGLFAPDRRSTAAGWKDGVWLRFGRTAAGLWCLNVSLWQHASVTVINPFSPQVCHLRNKATIPDAKASPHVYCYNYLTFKSTLMSPGWSHSLSSFGFRALLLSNKVTFHKTASPWNTHPLINIHPPASAQPPVQKSQGTKAVGGLRTEQSLDFFWSWCRGEVNATGFKYRKQLSSADVSLPHRTSWNTDPPHFLFTFNTNALWFFIILLFFVLMSHNCHLNAQHWISQVF